MKARFALFDFVKYFIATNLIKLIGEVQWLIANVKKCAPIVFSPKILS